MRAQRGFCGAGFEGLAFDAPVFEAGDSETDPSPAFVSSWHTSCDCSIRSASASAQQP